jgi:hypothetical protein
MATYTAAKSVHKTLNGQTADKVTITGYERVTVIERGGAGPLWVSWDGNGNPPTAVAGADDTEYVAAGGFVEMDAGGTLSICGDGNDYSVVGVSA